MRAFFATLSVACLSFSPALAQGPGGGGGGGQGPGGGGNNQPGGIAIDASGVVKNLQFRAPSAKTAAKQRAAFAGSKLSDEMNRYSPLRCVSLVQLEKKLKELIKAGKEVPPELTYLAGVQRIDYLFVSEDTGDIIIGGPAEGFAPNAARRVLGIQTARPTLLLDDLLVALRSVPTNSQFGCSIDPVPQRLKQTQDWIARNSQAATAQVVAARYKQMAEIMGLQNVTVWGLPKDSHMANVFVEADVRMKRIVMGLEDPQVRKFRSHLAMLKPGANSLRRWWFTPYYDKFEVSDDKTAWHFAGQRCQLLSQEEYTTSSGERFDSPHKLKSAEKFAQQFTEKFPELCENIGAFAELQNCFDLTLLAAIIQQHGLADRIGWTMSLLKDAEKLPTKVFTPAKQVPTVANIRSHGGRLVLGVIGGGVMITPQRTLQGLQREPVGSLAKTVTNATTAHQDNWWWDVVPAEPKKATSKRSRSN